jgi:hypothetical protein
MADTIPAIVIPRGMSGSKLLVCVSFDAADLANNDVIRALPAKLFQSCDGAKLRVLREDGTATATDPLVSFERAWIGTDYWSDAKAGQLWSKLIARDLLNNAKDENTPQTLMKAIYSQEEPAIDVNPQSRSDFAPRNRLESINPITIAKGNGSNVVGRIRQSDPLLRRRLDETILAGLEPNELERTLVAFADHAERNEAKYPERVVASLRELVSHVTVHRRSPKQIITGWDEERRTEWLDGFVSFRIAQQERTAAQEYQRMAREMRSGRNRDQVKQSELKKRAEKPSFGEFVSRIRQHPGLARRVGLVVAGTIDPPAGFPHRTSSCLKFEPSPASTLAFAPYLTKFVWDKSVSPAIFRAVPKKDTEYAPTDHSLILRHNVFDPKLYRATQQDFVQSAARVASRNDSTIQLPAKVEPDDPPPSEELLNRELKANRSNAVFIVSKPAIDDHVRPDPGTAEEIDRRLRDSKSTTVDRILHAEDLASGITVFVRKKGTKPWHSLCRRIVRVYDRNGGQLAHFEEECGIGSGTTFQPMPRLAAFQSLSADSRSIEVKTPSSELELWKISEKTRVTSPVRGFASPNSLRKDDVLIGTLGYDGVYSHLEFTPPLRMKTALRGGDQANEVQLIVMSGTGLRDGETVFASVNFMPTGFVAADGRSLSAQQFIDHFQAGSNDVILIEGSSGSVLAGPSYPPSRDDADPDIPSLAYQIQTSRYDGAPFMNDPPIIVHESIPPAVLRDRHLRKDDECKLLKLARPDADGTTPGSQNGTFTRWKSIDLIDLQQKLEFRRGTVCSIGFELVADFERAAMPDNSPTAAFVNVKYEPWMLILPNGSHTVGETDANSLTSPRLFPKQIESAVEEVEASPNGQKQSKFRMKNDAGGLRLDVPDTLTKDWPDLLGKIRMRIVGSISSSVSETGNRAVTFTAERVAHFPPTDEPTWILNYFLKAEARDGKPFTVAYNLKDSVSDPNELYREEWDNDPALVHPADSSGFLLDFITDPANGQFGRAWPQAVPGTAFREQEQSAKEFQTIDGLRIRKIVGDSLFTGTTAQTDSGYFLLRPLSSGIANASELTSGRQVELLKLPDDPDVPPNPPLKDQFAALFTASDRENHAYLAWNTNANLWTFDAKRLLPLVGEVTGFVHKEGMEPTIEMITPDKGRAGLVVNAEDRFQPPLAEHPVRYLGDLARGEFVLSFGELRRMPATDNNPPGQFVPAEFGTSNKRRVSAVVRGSITRTEAASTGERVVENNSVRRARITTPNLTQFNIWYPGSAGGPIGEWQDGLVFLSQSVNVETMTIKKANQGPMIAAAASGGQPKTVQVLATDFHTKWSNWCLTTPMPGDSAENQNVSSDQFDFHILCDRNRHGLPTQDESRFGPWKMLPLRFDNEYEFLLRRNDLAGNHLFDEGKPDESIDPDAVQTLQPLLGESVEVRAAAELLEANQDGRTFKRADPPIPMPLAWPFEQSQPVWQTEPIEVKPGARSLRLTAFQREPILVLFSDVFGRVPSLARDASAYLLPAPAAVESVIMHGVLDKFPPHQIPEIIKLHERYHTTGYQGVDRHGRLNYFGDPQVLKARVDFLMNQSGETPVNGEAMQFSPHGEWPCPCPIDLRLEPKPAEGEAVTLAELDGDVQFRTGKSEHGHAIIVSMPLGATGSVRVQPILTGNVTHDTKQRIKAYHVSNGARTVPVWSSLQVAEPVPNDTSRKVSGQFVADIPTTNSYTMASYWNDCWDQSFPLGWEEAKFPALKADFGTGTIGIPAGQQGYGYGEQAVALLTVKPGFGVDPSVEWPILKPVVEAGRCVRTEVVKAPVGWPARFDVRIIRRPPLFRYAEATIDRSDCKEPIIREKDIRITDAGGWYTAPPFVVITDRNGTGYGAKATAILNGQGGIGRVRIDACGTQYSQDVEIRFYTNSYQFPEVTIPRTACSTTVAIPERWQPFADYRSRFAEFYLTAHPRHQKFLLPASTVLPKANDTLVRTPIARSSLPQPLHTKASVMPMPPRVAHPLLAFHWSVTDGDTCDIDPLPYFTARSAGWLKLTRTEAIRVYLRRPWHQSGVEQLGVVLADAILNTTRTTGNFIEVKDNAAVNRASEYAGGQPPPEERIERDIIPTHFRELVSQWGYDPVWNERALPPLTLAHFPHARAQAEYREISSSDGQSKRLAKIALHDVRYDAAKNLWYSDLILNLNDIGQPIGCHPFVRLNLVTWQDHARDDGHHSSIVATDPIPITGERQLIAERKDAQNWRFELKGQFAENPKQEFPKRRVVLEVQRRPEGFPPEVELILSEKEKYDRSKHLVVESELAWNAGARTYTADLKLPPALWESQSKGRYAIVVREDEFYRTLADQPSASGDRIVMIGNAPCVAKTLSSFRFVI